jgi:hypothetical protein
VVTTETLVMVMTWPSESEVVAVSVIVLVLARKEVDDAVDDVVAEEVSGSIEKNEVSSASKEGLVRSVND